MKTACMALALVLVAASAYAEGEKTIQESYVGCREKEDYQKMVSLAVSGDLEAHKKFLLGKVMVGECRPLPRGETAYIEDHTWTGLAKIRIKGDTEEWWTGWEAVK